MSSKVPLDGGNKFKAKDQTYVCCGESVLRPPGTFLTATKCLLLHLLTFCVLCVSLTPSSYRQAGRPSPQAPPPSLFSVVLKGAYLHFKRVRKMASVLAAVTVFCRVKNICWCDADKIYLAADATLLLVSLCTREQKGVTEHHKQPVWASD